MKADRLEIAICILFGIIIGFASGSFLSQHYFSSEEDILVEEELFFKPEPCFEEETETVYFNKKKVYEIVGNDVGASVFYISINKTLHEMILLKSSEKVCWDLTWREQ